MSNHPRVGISAIIPNPSPSSPSSPEFLMGLRKGSHGAGKWATPGGHLEHAETFFACAERETHEETGLKVKALRVVGVTNDFIPENETATGTGGGMKHYVTIYVECRMVEDGARAEVMERDKCEGWEWVRWKELKDGSSGREVFLPIGNLLGEYPDLEKGLGKGGS